jgi:hypothetical protein
MSLWDDFVEMTQRVFAPLEDKFGFKRQPPNYPFVDYDSSTLRISLCYDPERRHELDIAIRRKTDVGTRKPSTGISPLMSIHDPAAWETYSSPYPKDRQSLESSLLTTRDLLFKYGASLLAGDLSDLDKIDGLQKQVEAELRKLGSSTGYKEAVKRAILKYHN